VNALKGSLGTVLMRLVVISAMVLANHVVVLVVTVAWWNISGSICEIIDRRNLRSGQHVDFLIQKTIHNLDQPM
jgi:hypothetical protein